MLEANSLLVIDLEKCTRCDNCVRACSDAHGGVTRLIREGLRFDKFLVPTSCRHCRDPLCMVGCPVGSIRRHNSLETVIMKTGASAADSARGTVRSAISTCRRLSRRGRMGRLRCARLPHATFATICPSRAVSMRVRMMRRTASSQSSSSQTC